MSWDDDVKETKRRTVQWGNDKTTLMITSPHSAIPALASISLWLDGKLIANSKTYTNYDKARSHAEELAASLHLPQLETLRRLRW
jgi:hypothetical protein